MLTLVMFSTQQSWIWSRNDKGIIKQLRAKAWIVEEGKELAMQLLLAEQRREETKEKKEMLS